MVAFLVAALAAVFLVVVVFLVVDFGAAVVDVCAKLTVLPASNPASSSDGKQRVKRILICVL